mgnify:CR=1 FL=1
MKPILLDNAHYAKNSTPTQQTANNNPIIDMQDIRNIIIDILSSGSVKNYKESILETSTIKELKEQYYSVQEKIKANKETFKETKEKIKSSQMSLFDQNTPEGLPSIDRSPKQC